MSRLPAVLALALLLPALSRAADPATLSRGTIELGLNGAVYVPHDSAIDLFGVLGVRGGVYAFRNHQFGLDATVFAYSRIQDVYVSGFYRYSFAGRERRLVPYVGAGLGANATHSGYMGTRQGMIVKAQTGIRYFFNGGFSLDVGYDLMFRRDAAYSLSGGTSSVMTFGFSKDF